MRDSDSRVPWLYRFVSARTAQSEPIAVVLLLGITIVGSGVVVVFGANAIEATKTTTDIGQSEQAMTQLDAKASLVAHGPTDAQRVSLSRNSRGTMRLDEDGPWMRVNIINGTDGNVTVMNASLGSVTYERGRTTIAYQGGGVWSRRDDGSVMVSPPEFHYKGGTLTLPLVLVRGDVTSGRHLLLSQQGPSVGKYPNATTSNPLEEGSVNVTVHSKYYRAWGRFFEQRTSGAVDYDDPNETVTIKLITPFEEGFNNVVAATEQGGITVNGNDPPPSPSQTGVDYPLADSRIEDRIDDCESGGGCTAWAGGNVGSPGRYYASSSVSSSFSVDTSGGDVELVVNGSFDPGDVTVTGNNNVTVFVRRDFSVSGAVNDGAASGNASQFRTLVHSDGDVALNGNYKYVGLIYAPGSDVDLNGGGAMSPNVVGGLVGRTVTVNGDPNDFQYDDSVEHVDFGLGPDTPRILYLHVSTTKVRVSD